jgi:hypothetical protein
MSKLLLLLLIPLTTMAQEHLYLSEEELNPEAEEILIKRPEKYLRHESMIYDLDTDLGIKEQRQFTGEDRNRISLAGHVSGDYEHFSDLFGGEINYMRRTTRYNQVWWGFQVFLLQTYFDAITENHPANLGAAVSSEASFQRPGGVKQGIFAGGLGVGYRFKLLLDFLRTEDMFETVDVFGNYLELDESSLDVKYRGYGLTTSYGIHKRASTSFFYGGKFSYNIASVTRDAFDNESRRNRSLTLGWLSLGFEMGFFF